MLQVTARAVTLLNQARSERGVPEHFGLRVRPPASERDGGIRLEFAEAPGSGDEVAETGGMRLFLATDVAEPLAELAIDAESSPSGSKLVLRGQDELPESEAADP